MIKLLLLLSLWSMDVNTPCDTKIQRHPEVRLGIMQPDLVLTERYIFSGNNRHLAGVWVFQGVDPGDLLELSVSVYADKIPVVLTSPHKEAFAYYDAWRWFPNYVKHTGEVRNVAIDITANVTGENHTTPRAEGVKTARPHYGVWFVWECDPHWADYE